MRLVAESAKPLAFLGFGHASQVLRAPRAGSSLRRRHEFRLRQIRRLQQEQIRRVRARPKPAVPTGTADG